MKKRNAIVFLVVLVMGMVFISGCTDPGSPGTVVTVPPEPTGTVTGPASPLPTFTSGTPVARYTVGDIVWTEESNYDADAHRSRGMIILQVNPHSYTYQYVSKDDSDILWSRFYPNEEIEQIGLFEETYSRTVDHTATIMSQYPSRTAFEDALSSGASCSPSLEGTGTPGSLNCSGSGESCS